jgi:hypothetical protein
LRLFAPSRLAGDRDGSPVQAADVSRLCLCHLERTRPGDPAPIIKPALAPLWAYLLLEGLCPAEELSSLS